MGNCCKKESSIHFGSEDWASTTTTSESLLSNEESAYNYGSSMKGEEEKLMGNNHASFSSNNVTEVKIKISKKQLEELVKRASVEGVTIQEAIIQLMEVGDGYEHQHHRSWKPALQSIPETEVN